VSLSPRRPRKIPIVCTTVELDSPSNIIRLGRCTSVAAQ
jgi:hypothetical protein